ncbi:dual specificity protein phosphatase 16 [Rhinichthys klamathensis goyatoka]|uniref:dual specificity protein phosphatase 16 n=1 Tax=Rhinichthys klamathensis goyatoka TaxID=3034132 RepID=UPI0024B4E265|nr:dual specificity protein phosphatase 16 [Rhinichthys klamathensis goyatoka]
MCERVCVLGPEALVALLEGDLDRVLLIDCRPFLEFNTGHIMEAVNVHGSKLMKRRLMQDKTQISELLMHCAKRKLELQGQEVVVYDQSSSDPASLSHDAFLSVLLAKLEKSFPSVHLLSGGFSEFCRLFPGLCEGKSALVPSCVSQPSLTLPVTNPNPTRILTHLYLGCQRDVLNQELMQQNDISYVLNASNTCPKPDFIPDTHFLRVPVNDSFCEKILPWLDRSVEFIEKAKASDARVLVHCLAGISRSATIAIAYIMKRMDMSLDEAYRFVKEKRPTISPNFNFLGQLLDFEKKLRSERVRPRAGVCDEPRKCVSEEPGVSEERLLTRALCGLALGEDLKESSRPKRSFSLDITTYSDSGATLPGQFSPVQELSEQNTPEQSPGGSVCVPRGGSVCVPRGGSVCVQLQRSESMDESPAAPTHSALLKGWHSNLVLGGWFLSDSARFCSGSAPARPVRRRGRSGESRDSRRSWHEESSFEKQLKRRSCQMEFGVGGSETRPGEELGTTGTQSSFSGSLEIIQVS